MTSEGIRLKHVHGNLLRLAVTQHSGKRGEIHAVRNKESSFDSQNPALDFGQRSLGGRQWWLKKPGEAAIDISTSQPFGN